MRNANWKGLSLAPLDFDPDCVKELLAPPLPVVVEDIPFAAWEVEQRAWAETMPAVLG